MEFFLTVALLAAVVGLLSAAISFPVYRMKKPLAVVLGIILLVVLSWGAFVLVVIVSAHAGHPL